MLASNHYRAVPWNDSTYAVLYELLIEELDPEALLFSGTEAEQIRQLCVELPQAIHKGNTEPLTQLAALNLKATERALNVLEEIKVRPEQRNVPKEISFDAISVEGQKLKDRWLAWLKYESLQRMAEMYQSDSGRVAPAVFFQQHDLGVWQRVLNATVERLKKGIQGNSASNALQDVVLNAIAQTHDPHTRLVSSAQAAEFRRQLTSQDYRLGVSLHQDNEGNFVIGAVEPGSAAWRSGQIHRQDRILYLTWDGEPTVSLAGMDWTDFERLFENKDRQHIQLTVQKVGGAVVTVKLVPEKVDVEENLVHSFLLLGSRKLGYIHLPGFYSDWGGDGSQCTQDVARELIKLKQAGVEGLILDMRFNGGGSMEEAISLAGIFINEGPLAITKNREGKMTTIRDPTRGTIFQLPMVCLVNSQTASAAEFVSACLQDYRRSLIVGSATHGKATAQQVMPLGQPAELSDSLLESESIALVTYLRIYRVDGASYQGVGVQPDISLPDVLNHDEFREKRYRTAYLNDNILPKYPFTRPQLPFLGELVGNSQKRVRELPAMQKVIEDAKKIRPSDHVFSLTAEAFLRKPEAYPAGPTVRPYTVTDSIQGSNVLAFSALWREAVGHWREALEQDIQLQETYRILCDLIDVTK